MGPRALMGGAGTVRVLLALVLAAAPARASEETLATFDACWSAVGRRFYDRELHGVDWRAVRREFRPEADRAAPGAELHAVLRAMLARLGASHTTILEDPVHRALMAELADEAHPTFGLLLEEDAGRWFVRAQYEDGAGPRAGLRRGDEVVAVDGVPTAQAPERVLAGYDPALDGDRLCFLLPGPTGRARLAVRRDPGGGLLAVDLVAAADSGLAALRRSVRWEERSGVRLGGFHVWFCSAGVAAVVREVLAGPLADCDALVVDLRGRGGMAHVVTELEREILRWQAAGGARRPVILLQDGRTRSAKEMLTWRFRRSGAALLVGERTEGAVLAAGFQGLPDGSWLELAVADVPVTGTRLEGAGVEPDVSVESWLPYARGLDLIHETGCHEAVLAVRRAEREARPAPRPVPREDLR